MSIFKMPVIWHKEINDNQSINQENMFRTNLEDGREAPSKASSIQSLNHVVFELYNHR